MAEIKVAQIDGGVSSKKPTKRELYATVCYFYPQYTLKKASRLPARDLFLLIRTANKMEAIKFNNLTQIVAAPHTEKGQAVSELITHFKEIIEES